MRSIKSLTLILAIGIAAFGLTITPAKAAQFTIDSGGGYVTVQEISAEAGQTDRSGGSDIPSSRIQKSLMTVMVVSINEIGSKRWH